MAEQQATQVHQDVVYDVEVDTIHASPRACARTIVTTLHLT